MRNRVYVLNPGDFADVLTFTARSEALASLARHHAHARLYSFNGRAWHEYFPKLRLGESQKRSFWSGVERPSLPVKVLTAGAERWMMMP